MAKNRHHPQLDPQQQLVDELCKLTMELARMRRAVEEIRDSVQVLEQNS